MLSLVARWYAVETADERVFTSAPYVFRYEKTLAAPPAAVWESLASDESLAAWSSTVTAVTWTSPRPFGVGTTREVVLAPGLARVHERFFRWDEGQGYSFAVYEANLPVFETFAEDYAVEPHGPDGDSTRFTWTVAIEPKRAFALPFKPLAPVLKLAFGRLAADGERHFARTG
jgi:polyketide cyclase/dehydrase/lipid transport protein